MKILVIGGTGTTGSQLLKELLARKASVRVMSRSPEKIKKLPAGVEGVAADLDVKSTLAKAFEGIDRVFLLTPLSQTETQEGLNAVEAAKAAGVKRIVYMSVHLLESILDAPHFARKIPIENAIKASGIPYTLIRPNNFYQNDSWFQHAIMEYGMYPQPIGRKGLSRVDVRDIAEAAANALLDDGFTGKTFSLVGPDILNGETTARILTKHFGKEIKYAGDDLDAWAEQARKGMPGWAVDDFRMMYDGFQKNGFIASPQDLAQTEQIIGKKPRSYEAYAAELASLWKK
jgi:uncharacterized protein YbjT (DUF2867 family)